MFTWFEEVDNCYKRLRKIIEKNGLEALQLFYEDDIEDEPINGYTKICDFLNIKPQEIGVKYAKSNPYLLKDVIKNFDEVLKSFDKSKYKWMVKE